MRILVCLMLAIGLSACQSSIEADTLIENGQVFIGDNTPAQDFVVAIKNDEIIYVGVSKDIKAAIRIDAKDKYVIPGFIDPHTHSLSELLSDDPQIRTNRNYLFQGVTTVFNGNDGFGDPDIAGQMASLTDAEIGTNTALFIGHGALRKSVMGGEKRAPTTKEMNDMKSRIHDGMNAGAIGLSTGLFYAPGSFAKTDEVIELAKIVSEYGGVYDSHIRDEASYNIGLEAAVDEVITIAREANMPANISHIKALGVDVWGKSDVLIDKVEKARATGLQITADQYPWQASGTRISNALIPRWVKAGEHVDYQRRLNDPDLRERIVNETAENLRKRGGPEAVLITKSQKSWRGKTLGKIAKENGLTPVDMAIEIARSGDARIASFNMNKGDIENFMLQDWVMTSSDGSTGHPRKFASYPKKYRDYVIQKSLIPAETFFYRSSGLVADTFGLCGRGYIKKNYRADIAIIDPLEFAPRADFQNAELLSTGVDYLFINGRMAIDDRIQNPELAGQVVKRCKGKTNAQ